MPYAFDPELRWLADIVPDISLDDIELARQGLDAVLRDLNADVDTAGLVVEDTVVPGPGDGEDVPVRVYRPEGDEVVRPALLTIHGGGFVLGNIEMEHAGSVALASRLDAVVVAVDYRLAPEHPYPAGLEDCYAALCWMHDDAGALGIDSARIAVGGQSAGGGLAAGLALLARDRGGPPVCFQFLGIPELDDRLETESMTRFVDTPLWNRPAAELSWRHYLAALPPGDVPPYAAPARATDLTGLPPAYVTTMEFDPLRDEGILYAMRLLQAGVPVELHSFAGTFHGSSIATDASISRRAQTELYEVLRRALAPRTGEGAAS